MKTCLYYNPCSCIKVLRVCIVQVCASSALQRTIILKSWGTLANTATALATGIAVAVVDSLLDGLWLPNLPKLEVFVTSSGSHRTAVGGQSRCENTVVVRGDIVDLLQGRVAPKRNVVVGEAVGGEQLLGVRGPDERGDLRASGKGRGACAGRGRPEVDVLVLATTTGGKEVGLPRAPRKGLRNC